MATLKFYNKAGQLVELTGVNGLRATKSDGTKLTYIAPSGKLNITDMALKDVTNYAQAQIVDANLVAGNIKKGVTILGVTGTFEGGSSMHYVTFTAQEANSSVKIEIHGTLSPITLYYSNDNTTWQPYTINTVVTLANIGDHVSFYGVANWRAYYSTSNYLHFVMTGKIAGSGNCNALLDAYTDVTMSYCCYGMFQNCTALTATPNLPATVLTNYCYSQMFYGCTNLVSASDLPATTLANYCCSQMFQGCSKLTQAPALPATTLKNYCYSQMFQGCALLTQAPELPATVLEISCYQQMFQGCTNLTSAPELPATTMKNNCYSQMFSGCTKLTQAPALPATTLANYCYEFMFLNCTSLTQAPDLPATTLVTYCYSQMFSGCRALTSVKTAASAWNTTNAAAWLSGVASAGTVYCPSDSTIPSGSISGIPTGWSRADWTPAA